MYVLSPKIILYSLLDVNLLYGFVPLFIQNATTRPCLLTQRDTLHFYKWKMVTRIIYIYRAHFCKGNVQNQLLGRTKDVKFKHHQLNHVRSRNLSSHAYKEQKDKFNLVLYHIVRVKYLRYPRLEIEAYSRNLKDSVAVSKVWIPENKKIIHQNIFHN